jgi:hypothetical protein
MQIDPSQPIIFDTDSAPGRGIGYWQNNFDHGGEWDDESSPRADTATARVVQRIVFAMIVGGITLGALDMFLR